jgi:CTP synthase
LDRKASYTLKWENVVEKIHRSKEEVTIGIVGKYTALSDAYLSIREALRHGGVSSGTRVLVKWLESDDCTAEDLKSVDGILVPGGFGQRGAEGKIKAIKYAREKKVPFLGICFGFQLAVVEFARSVCRLEGANTTEVDANTPHPVIDLLPEQKDVYKKGGTMRLGAYPCKISPGTLAHSLYLKDMISERHRHRWEVNPKYIKTLEEHGLKFTGRYPDKELMEIAELPNHPYFIACQFHPEFKSRLDHPAPLFDGFVRAALKKRQTS